MPSTNFSVHYITVCFYSCRVNQLLSNLTYTSLKLHTNKLHGMVVRLYLLLMLHFRRKPVLDQLL